MEYQADILIFIIKIMTLLKLNYNILEDIFAQLHAKY